MNRFASLAAWAGSVIGKPPGWERVIRWITPPERCQGQGELAMVRDGVALCADPGVLIGWHLTFFGTYEPELREIFAAVLRPGAVAVDVGANIGWHTTLMSRCVGDGGHVIAVEPNPSVRASLERNLALAAAANVAVVPSALGATEGTVRFFAPEASDPRSGDGHVVRDADDDAATTEIQITTLDLLAASMKIPDVALIKIDVEGYEWPVLQGATRTIARHRPQVVFEYNAQYAHRGQGKPDEMHDFFERQGYRLFSVGRRWGTAINRGHWPAHANIWATPESPA